MPNDDPVEIPVHVHAETDAAVLVSDDGEESNAEWIPKSQIEWTDHKGPDSDGTIAIPEWLAMDRGFI